MAEATSTENTGIEMMEVEPPPYEEALQMRRLSTPVDDIRRDISPLITPSPLPRLQFVYETVLEEEEEEGAETELPGLVSPGPPIYPSDPRSSAPHTPDSGRPSTTQPPTAQDRDMVRTAEPLCLYLHAGIGGLRMPRTVLRAWKIGAKSIMATGVISNWARYIFLAVQSILLFGGILFSYFVDFDQNFYRYLRIGVLGAALIVNFIERFSYWCVHALSNLDDNGVWNFCADIVRLVLTEIFIYAALVTTVFTTSETYEEEFIDFPKNSTRYAEYEEYGNSMLAVMSLLYFLTACLMRNYTVFSITRSLLKARVAKTSNASSSQKCFLYGLCAHTIAQSLLQVLLLIFIGLVFHEKSDHLGDAGIPFIVVFIILAEVVPLLSLYLYFTFSLPCGKFFPLSMLIDLPPDRGRRDPLLNMQAVSSWFQTAHDHSMTCKAILIDYLRPLMSPLQYFIHVLFFLAANFVGWCLVFVSYFSAEGLSTLARIASTTAFIVLAVFSLPSLLLALLMIILLPVLGPASLLVCIARTLIKSH